MSQAWLKDTIEGISRLIDDSVTTLVTLKGHRDIGRTDNRLNVMRQGFVIEATDEKLGSEEFGKRLLHVTEDITSSPRHVRSTAYTMLHKQYCIAPVAKFVKKEAEKVVDVESKRGGQRQKFVEAAYNTGARSGA